MIRSNDITVKIEFGPDRRACTLSASVTLQAIGTITVTAANVDALVSPVSEELKKSVLRRIYGDIQEQLYRLQTGCRELFDERLSAQNRRERVMTLVRDVIEAIGIDRL